VNVFVTITLTLAVQGRIQIQYRVVYVLREYGKAWVPHAYACSKAATNTEEVHSRLRSISVLSLVVWVTLTRLGLLIHAEET
jgi:hypothetical protein